MLTTVHNESRIRGLKQHTMDYQRRRNQLEKGAFCGTVYEIYLMFLKQPDFKNNPLIYFVNLIS